MEVKQPRHAAEINWVPSDTYNFTDEERDRAILDLQAQIQKDLEENDRRDIKSMEEPNDKIYRAITI